MDQAQVPLLARNQAVRHVFLALLLLPGEHEVLHAKVIPRDSRLSPLVGDLHSKLHEDALRLLEQRADPGVLGLFRHFKVLLDVVGLECKDARIRLPDLLPPLLRVPTDDVLAPLLPHLPRLNEEGLAEVFAVVGQLLEELLARLEHPNLGLVVLPRPLERLLPPHPLLGGNALRLKLPLLGGGSCGGALLGLGGAGGSHGSRLDGSNVGRSNLSVSLVDCE
mmetsp:Transcript_3100/g.7590  ORF Transcript_3100/g.7590 Transcript_3100/m.7590 type:complete len:222 (-) Transcript_3100:946-1611(-)